LRAIEQAVGIPDYFIISNPDIEVDASAVRECVAFLEQHEDYAVAAPHMMRPDGTCHHLAGWRERTFLCDLAYSSGILSRLIGMYRETYPEEHWKAEYSSVDCVTGSFFIIRGRVFSKLGYFDEGTFLFYEEDILGYRLKRLGYKEAVLNTCTFVHEEGVSAGQNVNYIKKYLMMQKSRLYFHQRYKRLNIFKYLILCLATCLGFFENLLKTIIKKS
jgi:N-acetylglucosaminyl-diphospho-decaprenol L-rhamnosyltransferase